MITKDIKIIALLLFITLFWLQVLGFDFVWDDFPSVVHNPALFKLKTIFTALKSDFWSLHEYESRSGYFRPLVTWVYVGLSTVFGKDPMAFHAMNLLGHVLMCLCVFSFYRWLGFEGWLLMAMTVLYAIFPLHSEPVSFVSCLPDLLCGLFCMLGLQSIMKVKHFVSMSSFNVILFFVLALLSKETAVIFPLLALLVFQLLDKNKEERVTGVKVVLILLVVLLFYLFYRQSVAQLGIHVSTQVPLLLKLKKSWFLFLESFRFIFFPVGLNPVPSFSFEQSFLLQWILCLMFFGLMGFAWFKYRSYRKQLLIAIMMYVVAWAPHSNWIELQGLVVDRYFYLSLVFMILSLGFVLRAHEAATPLKLVVLFVIVWIAIVSFKTTAKWSSSKLLWATSHRMNPSSIVIQNEYGLTLIQQNLHTEALKVFEKLYDQNKHYQDGSYNYAYVLYKLNDFKSSKEIIEKHLGVFPLDDRAYDFASSVYLKLHELENAIRSGERAIDIKPSYWKYRYNLAMLLHSMGKHAKALDLLRGFEHVDEMTMLMGNIHFDLGQFKQSQQLFSDVLKNNPKHEQAMIMQQKNQMILQLVEE